MFHYDRGLKITEIDLAVDFQRRQPRGFISHAHRDHMAPHELAFATPATSLLYQYRFGKRPTRLMPYSTPLEWDHFRLTTHPAGHVLGSAMLLVETEAKKLLYTGDFKLGASSTAEAAQPPKADVLVMESTYGDPAYRLPPRDEAIEMLRRVVEWVLNDGRTPVVHAYVLGKGQEVTRILTNLGFRVLQHPLVHAISQIYEQCGCALGNYALYDEHAVAGAVVVAPPKPQKQVRLRGLVRPVSIGVTGWAVQERYRFRQGVDYAVPLSDHADYDELVACVERVEPREIFCTHGPESFVKRLQALGFNAHPLNAPQRQLRLF
jgi:putative mRNA 3-end processing factor